CSPAPTAPSITSSSCARRSSSRRRTRTCSCTGSTRCWRRTRQGGSRMLWLALFLAASPPNIVFILADDLGYGDVGAYGQTKILTPRLDRMAREGTRFTQFYAGSPVCAPSRRALMTGQHTGHTSIRGNKEHPGGQEPLPDTVTTVADVLRGAGYATGAFGKWGLGGPDTEGTPARHGFDEFFGYYDQRRAHFYY